MFVQKIQILTAIVITGATMHSAGAPARLHELDSVGKMPEIIVTAPRYEYQDEAWLGMIEEVVVEAPRPLNSGNGTDTIDESSRMVSGKISSRDIKSTPINTRTPICLLMSLTLTLVTLSIVYMSLRAYLAAKEVEHDGTKH